MFNKLVKLVNEIGCTVFHEYYKWNTSDQQIRSNRDQYYDIAYKEYLLTGLALQQSQEKRRRLFLWFHARGLDIDEDHEDISRYKQWQELIDYWKLASPN